MESTIQFTVNGQPRSAACDPARPLLEVLREDFQLTGCKYGCGEGQCGACTVLIDGKRTFSCLTQVGDVADKAITTVEGLARGDVLHPVQQAFMEAGAFQCGYCTSGMIMATVALISGKPDVGDAEMMGWMNTNVCRCCGYAKIRGAIKRSMELTKAGV
jgi:carbon-monoxide dehydrogenase small subunit